MNQTLSTPKSQSISAVEYLRAKLDYEATPYGLNQILAKTPEQVLVLDVRDAASFRAEHIQGAMNIPAADLISKLSTLPKDKTIVTYCWDMTCSLAPKMALELAQKGFRVQFLVGGLAEWTRKGFPVAKKA